MARSNSTRPVGQFNSQSSSTAQAAQPAQNGGDEAKPLHHTGFENPFNMGTEAYVEFDDLLSAVGRFDYLLSVLLGKTAHVRDATCAKEGDGCESPVRAAPSTAVSAGLRSVVVRMQLLNETLDNSTDQLQV